MDPYYAGWLSILPPIIAIGLALLTKEVMSSLMIGILSGTLIYSVGTGASSLFIGTIDTAFSTMADKIDFNILLFCTLLGALVYVMSLAGGTKAYGRWASSKIKSKKATMLATGGLGVAIFIDDYFNCLTVGTVMQPLTDSHKISRAKLAYLIDATAAPICIIAPISSWAAAVGSNLKATGAFSSEMSAFIATIPYNFYALLSILMVILVSLFALDFGKMRLAEIKAQTTDLVTNSERRELNGSDHGTIADMLVPLLALIVFAVMSMLYTGGYWGDDPAFHTFGAAFGECDASKGLVWAAFGAILVAFLMYIPRKLISFNKFMDGVMEGMKAMLPADVILILAWTIGGVCRDLLQTPEFVKNLVEGGSFALGVLPAIVFVIAGFLSFSTGTAWGTFGILIPIIVPVAQALDPQLVVITLSATLAGSVFGDHCSPISDTTILASAGAGCSHIEHVSTQMGYALVVASACVVGYLIGGFTHGALWPSLGGSVVTLLILVKILHSSACKKAAETANA